MSTVPKRERLKAIIRTKTYITGGDFKLASGVQVDRGQGAKDMLAGHGLKEALFSKKDFG